MSVRNGNQPRRKRRTSETPPGRAIAQGLVVIGILAVAFVLALRAPNGVPGVNYKTIYAVVPDVGNLQRHSDVRIAGKRIGQIMDTTAEHGEARLELQLSPSAGSVPADSTVVVRSQGLLGQRYLQVQPGRSPQQIRAGGTLRAADGAITLGIPEALQTFDAETRGGLGKAVSGLGSGLMGRGRDLNAAIGAAPDAASDFRTVAGAITADQAAARQLVPDLSRAAGALNAAKRSLAATLEPGARALQPFVDRRAAVRATLAKAPQTLDDARAALADGLPLLANARRLSRAAARTLHAAPESLRATTALLRDARAPLARVEPLLARARTTVPATLELTRRLSPVLGPLEQPLDDLLNPVKLIAAHGCDIANFAQVWRSFLGFGVPNGSRIGPLGEIRAEALVAMPYGEAGDAARLPAQLVKHDVYPAACNYLGKPYSLVDPTK